MSGCLPPPVTPPTDVLDIAVSEILGRGNPYAYSTIATIERYLHQFHLAGRVEVFEIVTEAYLRGKRLQRQGTAIRNPHAWLKRTAYNIVREEQRRFSRHPAMQVEGLDHHCLSRQPGDTQWEQIHLDMQLEALWQAFDILTQEDPDAAQLLTWRALNNLSWKQIWAHLAEQGGEVPNEATLRQRAARAKKHLRQIFHATC